MSRFAYIRTGGAAAIESLDTATGVPTNAELLAAVMNLNERLSAAEAELQALRQARAAEDDLLRKSAPDGAL